MKRRSGKIFAATLALLVCLNAMPLGTLAAEGEVTTTAAEQQEQSTEQDEQTGEQEQSVDEQSGEQPSAGGETSGSEGTTDDKQPVEEGTPADEEKPAEQEQPVDGETSGSEGTTDDKQPVEEETPVDEDKPVDDNQPIDEGQTEESSGVSLLSNEVTVSDDAANAEVLAETENVYYVGGENADDSNDGTEQDPFASLVKAVEKAEDGATIVLLSDVEAKGTARISDKHLTITSQKGQHYTISRVEDFEFVDISDNHQSWYNGAIIEVTAPTGTGDNAASVTLKNVTLDDKGRHAGKYFAQTNTSTVSESNTDFVQDSMITAHGKEDAAVYITLEDGAELKNFGGMSALYGTTNAHITMKSGSKITAVDVTNRSKSGEGKADETGPAGAVWLQGAEFNMESGAEISDVVGRAIYADVSAQATISGTIRNITGDTEMWQGKNGGAIHIRGGSTVTMKDGAAIDNAHDCTSIVRLETNSAHFTMEKGSKIVNGGETAISIFGTTGNPKENDPKDDLVANIDGEIAYIVGPWNGGNAININQAYGASCTIGENADIHNNQTWTGAIYMQGSALKLDIYGTIRDNVGTQHNGALWMANNFDDNMSVVMHPGAAITGNMCNSASGSGSAAAVVVSRGTFTMEGGTISGNKSRNGLAGGVAVRKSGVFIMNGGEITNNVTTTWGGGIAYNDTPESKECVILNGGTISGNIAQATAMPGADGKTYDLNSFSGGVSNDISIATKQSGSVSQYMQISDQMNIGNPNIHIEKYNADLTNPGGNVKFGNASANSITKLLEASTTAGFNDSELVSLWCYSGKDSTDLEFSNVQGIDESKPVYAAVVPVEASGDPSADAAVEFYVVTQQDDKLEVSFPSSNVDGYAVALVQPKEDYGTMAITMPETLDGKQADASGNYTLAGSATYNLSETLSSMMEPGNVGIDDPTFTIHLDKDVTIDTNTVTLTSDIFEINDVTFDENADTLTVTCNLKENWKNTINKDSTLQWTTVMPKESFEVDGLLNVTGRFTGTVNGTSIYVPATPAATHMVAGIQISVADITVYMGGHTDAVVDESGNITVGTAVANAGFPEPGFIVEFPDGVTSANVKFREKDGNKSWTLESYDDKNTKVYKIVPKEGQAPLRVQFTYADGKTALSDAFDVGTAVNQQLTMDLYKGSVGTVEAVVTDENGNEKTYYVEVEPGTLTVRGTTGNVQYGNKIAADEKAPAGLPAVKVADGTEFYINDSKDVMANADAVQLLFDDVINTTLTQQDRLIQLAQRADEKLGAPATGKVRNFTAKYLDLVDTSNGNAWVKASKKVTVCWPYPAGTNKDTEFTVLHFKGLHRDMPAGEISGDIANCEVEIMQGVKKMDTHIEFETDGFSPFALVWYTDKTVGGSGNNNETSSNTVVQTTQTTTSASAPAAAAQPAAVIPQTSDNSQPALWAGLLVFSGAALAALYLLKRRKQNGER